LFVHVVGVVVSDVVVVVAKAVVVVAVVALHDPQSVFPRPLIGVLPARWPGQVLVQVLRRPGQTGDAGRHSRWPAC